MPLWYWLAVKITESESGMNSKHYHSAKFDNDDITGFHETAT